MKTNDKVALASELETLSDEEIDELLNKFGPEGLYSLADKLTKAADRDMRQAIGESLEIKKVSREWYDDIHEKYQVIILNPDGWDRLHFKSSFDEEPVTKKEFLARLANSTISCDLSFHTSDWVKTENQ